MWEIQETLTASYQWCPEERICLLDPRISFNASSETNFPDQDNRTRLAPQQNEVSMFVLIVSAHSYCTRKST